jgi:glycosyltransferase 2 family protein
MRGHLRTFLLIASTAALLALFLRNANLAEVSSQIRSADPGLLLLGTIVTFLTYLLRSVRWQAMLQPIGHAPLSLAFRATVVGFAANFLLPARAGEVLRPYLLARRAGLSVTSTFATIVLERLLDLLTVLLLFGAFVFLFDPGVTAADPAMFRAVQLGGLLAAGSALAGLAVFFLLAGHPERLGNAVLKVERVLPPRLAAFVANLAQTFASGLAVMRQPRPLVTSVLMSLPLWLSIAAGIWLVTRAFHITMPFTGSFLMIALLTVGVAVPTPGAVGGFHYAFRIGATAFYGASNEQAVGAAIILHAITFLPVTFMGLVFMLQDGLNLSGLKQMARERETSDNVVARATPAAGTVRPHPPVTRARQGGPAA